MAATIHSLVPRENAQRDVAAISALFRDHGADAHHILHRKLSSLVLEVACAADLITARNLEDMPQRIWGISLIARDLGLISLAETAENAGIALRDPAFAALWARVLRLTEATLDPAHDLRAGLH